MEKRNPNDDGAFKVGVYTKGELAALYFPKQSKKGAQQAFRRLVAQEPGLLAELKESGYNRHKVLSPKIVQRIIDVLGLPSI